MRHSIISRCIYTTKLGCMPQIQAFKWALLFLFFLLFPTFLICSYFSLLFHENALLSLLFIPRRSRRDTVLASTVRQSVCPSVRPFRPSIRTFCLSGTISQYLLVRFNSFLVQMISTMNTRYPISLVKINPLPFELLPLFKYRQL